MIKFLSEFGPIIAFFVIYKVTGSLLDATLYMLITAIVTLCITYVMERRINKINLISAILLLISASLTLASGNSIFIKMKPTILYAVFAGIFLITQYRSSPAIQYVLSASIKLREEKSWYVLNFRFFWFFLFMGIANEVIWRNFVENIWVNFKLFGTLSLTLLFTMLQVPFIMRNQVEDSEK